MLSRRARKEILNFYHFREVGGCHMSYMSEWIYSEEDLREAVKEDRDRIREEIRQAIENGVIKIETGSEKLFEILNYQDK